MPKSTENKTLQSLLNRSFQQVAVIPILVIELLLILLYFSINFYISYKNESVLTTEVVKDIQHHAAREADSINLKLKEITRLSWLIQRDHQRFYEKLPHCKLAKSKAEFAVHSNGAYFKTSDNGGSSLYYAAGTKITDKEKNLALCSEVLDPLMKDLVDTNPLVTQAYLNTADNMNRLYPFIPDAPSQFGANMNISEYNFYYLADEEHNPSKQSVWTDAYLDPAGQGWMISGLTPIYHKDQFMGVSGLDITVEKIIENVLNIDLPWEGSAFLVDQKGGILAMPHAIEQVLSVKELTHHNYTDEIKTTITKPKELNLFEMAQPELKTQFQTIFNDKQPNHQLTINGEHYLISISTISETGWYLVTLIENNKFLAPIRELKQLSQNIGFAAILIMLGFYFVFFLHITARSKKISRMIAAPIRTLSQHTSTLGSQFTAYKTEHTDIDELDRLSQNFQKMSQELNIRASALIDAKVKEHLIQQEKFMLEKLAITDSLTGLYNRHRVDDIVNNEIERCQRYNTDLSILLLDIDFFKQINDSYGHLTGDHVLTSLTKILKQTVRATDNIGRWGGEEFIIVCPETNSAQAAQMADKIVTTIAASEFETVNKVTVSLGISTYKKGDTDDSLFQRADSVLYQAKKDGRNCWRVST